MKHILLTAVLLLGSISISARIISSGTCGTNLTWELNDEGLLRISGIGEMDDYTCSMEDTRAPWLIHRELIKEVSIESTVTTIGWSAFYFCPNLTSITIPESVTYIGFYAFQGCENLTTIVIPKSVVRIGDYAFYYCSSLTAITIPASVTSIGVYAFYECSSLTAITIPEGVTSIGNYAFEYCWNLTAITIPASVTSIGNYAFAYCSSLTTITVAEGNAKYDSRGGCNAIIETNSNTLIAGCSTTIIPEGVTSIGNGAFNGCSSLTAITIPESVTSIGNGAFYVCRSLTAINIPENSQLTSIGGYAFCGCISLTAINIPESVTSIGDYAFWSCISLTAINIPEGVTSIGDFAFYECSSLIAITITIPEGVTSIEQGAFNGCHSLTAITIPEGVTSIGDGAFYICSSLTSITIPEGVTSIEVGAFSGCSSLTAITVAEGNAKYDSRGGCNAIIDTNSNTLIAGCSTTIIPESVTSIGVWAFYKCTSLTAITIPEGVTSIGERAFRDCSSLTAITCEAKTPPTLEDSYVFFGVNKSIPVYVPASSVEAYKSAQYWSEFTNIQAIVNNVVLLDSQASFTQGEDEVCASISYTRNFKNTNWQALYVPFEIPVTVAFLTDFEVADINDIRQYDHDNDGVKDDAVIEAFKVKNGTLKANYPYLIRVKEVGEKSIVVTDATLYAAEENSIDCSSVHEKYTFTGTYCRMSSAELPQSGGYYALSGGIWQPVAEGASLGAFRFYLKVEDRHANTAITNARSIRVRVVDENGEEDDVTEISNSQLMMDDSKLIIYDLQGRRITDTVNLKGVYIVNGKKVVY